jgi:hypothetical protein
MKKILFNDKFCLTQAVLAGQKTMTRRIEKPTGMVDGYTMEDVVTIFHEYSSLLNAHSFSLCDNEKKIGVLNPRYQVGEVIAIAQPYKDIIERLPMYSDAILDEVGIPRKEYKAGWTNKMFVRADLMPHHIKITDVKVEHLQNISDDEILREGVWQFYDNKNLFYVSKAIGYAPDVAFLTARLAFWYLIDKISGKGTWERNPWVVAYSFELVD